MQSFLDLVLGFPTVIFSGLLLVVLLFWGFVILGALDHEMFDLDHDLEVGHGLEGGHGHDAMDMDFDADVDGHGHGDGDQHHGHSGGLVHNLGLAGVPLTIAFSFVALFGFVASALLSSPMTALLGAGFLSATAAGIASLGLALPVSSLCIRPLRKLYVSHDAVRRRSLVGQVCTITTQMVNDRFGQAEIEDGGAGFLVQVRSMRENTLTRLSKAVVFEYDAKDEVFLVAPLDEQATLPEPE